MTLRLFILQPTAIFAARVNMASVTYPLDELTFDTVTTGAYTDLKPGMTLLLGSSAGDDDLGRTRVRAAATATVIPVGRCSRGTRDGELDVSDNLYITVLYDYRMWSKIAYIDTNGIEYKDSDIVVGTYTSGDEPPVANAGVPACGTVDSGTGTLAVWLPHVANPSFAVADGASITDYLWALPSGVALDAGSALTDSAILVAADPGFYWIDLTVTDSNGNSHTARTWIFARDPDADVCIDAFDDVTIRRMRQGQTANIRVLEPIAEGTYPDGTLVALFDGEPASGTDRDNLVFWGWHTTDPAEIAAGRTGTLAGTQINAVDGAGRLDSLPGFPLAVYDDSQRDTSVEASITWAYMVDAHIDKLLHYLLHWHSTALELMDFTWSGTTTTFPFAALECSGDSIFEQVNRNCQALMPDYYLTCDRLGRLAVRVNPLLQDAADRTSTTQANITAGSWTRVGFTGQRGPLAYWLLGSAILASNATVNAIFSRAPGDAPGQGEREETHGGQLALSQTQLNAVTGHRYANRNAPQSLFRIALVPSQYPQGSEIDPAAMTWVTLTIPASVAAQRGLSFSSERGLVHELNLHWRGTRTGVLKDIECLWERETEGTPGVTYIPADAEPVDDGNDYWYVPPDYFYNPPQAFVLWDGAHVTRTWDILEASPTWEQIDTGITGAIIDGQYVQVDTNTVGMWLLTADAVWWCADILATTPSWASKLALATVQAADATPSTGSVEFRAMYNAASEPGFLIVATGLPGTTANLDYGHSYTWHTHDYGANWTQIDMDSYTHTTTGGTSGYWGCYRDGIDIHRSSGTIFMARYTPRWGVNDARTAVFKSTDGGHTWSKEYEITGTATELAILAPFPDINGPGYLIHGQTSVVNYPDLYVSTDQFATATMRSTPSGFFGLDGRQRVNSRTYIPDHVISWWWNDSSRQVVQESEDRGINWTSLYDIGLVTQDWSQPNGWPADIDLWIIVRGNGSGASGFDSPVIYLTEDRFASLQDKTGNLETLLTTWTDSSNIGGFLLPKVGPNA